MSSFVVKRFINDGYTAIFSPKSGFFARVEDSGAGNTFWATHGPELLDIAITNWCDKGCPFCYRKSDEAGTHMSIADYRELLVQAQEMHVFQVALGGGNPNQHPDFVEFLRMTREDFGIVPNFTTNGRGLTPVIVEAAAKYCGAVAVSAYAPFEETSSAVQALTKAGVETNIHYILSSASIDRAVEWLLEPPSFVLMSNALVFLNYKPVGRHANERLLLNRSARLAEFFALATTGTRQFKIGFDTCTITGLARLGDAVPSSLEPCDAARFSMFISETLRAYPCSFMVEAGYPGVSIIGRGLLDIWVNDDTFLSFRRAHQKGGCSECTTQGACLSGCPIFPQMNLCPSNCGPSLHRLRTIPYRLGESSPPRGGGSAL